MMTSFSCNSSTLEPTLTNKLTVILAAKTFLKEMNNFSHKRSFTMSQSIETQIQFHDELYTIQQLFKIFLLMFFFFFLPFPTFLLSFSSFLHKTPLHFEYKNRRRSAFVYNVSFYGFIFSILTCIQEARTCLRTRYKKQLCFHLLLRLSKALLSARIGSFAL